MFSVRCPLLFFAIFAVAIAPLKATTYNGNGNGGFGGAIGQGSLTLSDNGTDLTFTVTRGPGNFNDFLVFYFNTQSGGATSLPTSGEIGTPFGGRRAVVNEFGSGISSFPASFDSDYAFVLHPSGADQSNHLFTTPSGSNANTIGFVNTYTVSGFGSNSSATYSWSIPLADLGITAGQSFTFVTTYLNPFDGANQDATFRSNEQFGADDFGANNPGFSSVSFSTALTYQTTPVPEPSTWIAGSLALIGLVASQRRRIRSLLAR